MTEPSQPKVRPSIHPNSHIRGPLSKRPIVVRKTAKTKPFATQKSHLVASYGCPLCGKPMYASEIIDFSTVSTPTGRVPKKHHRSCMEDLKLKEMKDAAVAAKEREADERSATGPDLPA